MPNSLGKAIGLAAVVLVASASVATAQTSNTANNAYTQLGAGPRLSPAAVSSTSGRTSAATLAAAAAVPADRKDPVIAGVLSFVIPGLGSFYAGNTTHGMVHLGVDLGAYAVMIGGAADGNGGTLAFGYILYLGNGIWSIFTAVDDANVANGSNGTKPGRIVGELYFRPDIHGQATGTTPQGTRTATALQLLQWRY
jgi:hypothetical protein